MQRRICEQALLDSAPPGARPYVEAALDLSTIKEGRAGFREDLERYRDVELARPCGELVDAHEFGGHLRPLFALFHATGDTILIEAALALFHLRRQWVERELSHGYVDCNEVHHDPETFLYFQIPLLDATGDPDVLRAVEQVADLAVNAVPGAPAWYDWETHGFRSTYLGSKEVRDHHPYDYQEANHFRIVSIVLAAYRHDGRQRYLDLARDYAGRWDEHVRERHAAGGPIWMQILPEGGRAEELGYGGGLRDEPPEGVYRIFYRRVASNTAFDVCQGLQDVYRITSEERFLEAAGLVLEQFRSNRDPDSGRWPAFFSEGKWVHRTDVEPGALPIGNASTLLVRAALRQIALDPSRAAWRDDVVSWAEAVLEGDDPRDICMTDLLFGAGSLSGREAFFLDAYRRLNAGFAAAFGDEVPHCCNAGRRVGYGMFLETPLLLDQGLVEGGTRGSWPFAWPKRLVVSGNEDNDHA